eukprot:m.8053 g.8053  ORF g.8053 m.8053 type:complete len:52 (-) comp2249_c0_seq1:147-302(-)
MDRLQLIGWILSFPDINQVDLPDACLLVERQHSSLDDLGAAHSFAHRISRG